MGNQFSQYCAYLFRGIESQHERRAELVITGIGTSRPDNVLGPQSLRDLALGLNPQQPEWLQHLLKVNDQTGIEERRIVDYWNTPAARSSVPQTAEQTDEIFRATASGLAAEAATKALDESGISASSITHLVAVTGTNFSSPGFDLLVARELGIPLDAERILLSGVGCAGGVSALRVASNLANGASFRNKPCRLLIMACEIPSIQIRSELQAASASGWISIGPALFADGAASVVLCNRLGLADNTPHLYSIVDWRTHVSFEGIDDMWYRPTQWGFRLHLSREVPRLAAASISAPFSSLVKQHSLKETSLDWALHPGGTSIIKGVQRTLSVSDHQLRATWEVYKRQGNTSSVSVLTVLSQLRSMGQGSEDVISCSFGPGLTTEMVLLKRLC